MKQVRQLMTRTTMATMGLFFTLHSCGFATKIKDTKAVTGTEKLIEDTTSTLSGFALIVTVMLVIYFFIRKGAADEMDQKKWHTRIVIAVVCGICATLASALITTIFSYYAK